MFTFEALREWHWPQIPDEGRPTPSVELKGIVALDDSGTLVAAGMFDSWTFSSCQMHIYIKNPFVLKHGFAEELFNYAFNTCGKTVVIGVTPADNERALKFVKNIGLEEILRIRDGYKEGVAQVITQLRREDCRWIDQTERLNAVGEN